MEFTSTVLYGEHLSYYDVFSKDGCTFIARLLSYDGAPHAAPPKEITLFKDGDKWVGNADEDIIYFLGFDINSKLNRYAGRRMASL